MELLWRRADFRHDAVGHTQRGLPRQQASGMHEPAVCLLLIRGQLAGIALVVERVLQPRINWSHAASGSSHHTSSSRAASSASRARWTRIFNVGILAPVTAAISS